eukprot:2438393-Rhodomonas_salina.1
MVESHAGFAPLLAHPEIQHKKPHFQCNLYQECGFLYLSLQCSSRTLGWYRASHSTCPRLVPDTA